MASTFTLEAGPLVLYHGSQRYMHGEWQVSGPCSCHSDGWNLVDIWGRDRIMCVRRESFTPYDEIPSADPRPEHKTRTSQPAGYQYGADGSRMTDVRGRLMYDRGSYWFCTCGEIGAGADRAEARRWARSHRDRAAANEQAGYKTAIAALRARLESRST